jgi:hypothetical protein
MRRGGARRTSKVATASCRGVRRKSLRLEAGGMRQAARGGRAKWPRHLAVVCEKGRDMRQAAGRMRETFKPFHFPTFLPKRSAAACGGRQDVGRSGCREVGQVAWSRERRAPARHRGGRGACTLTSGRPDVRKSGRPFSTTNHTKGERGAGGGFVPSVRYVVFLRRREASGRGGRSAPPPSSVFAARESFFFNHRSH